MYLQILRIIMKVLMIKLYKQYHAIVKGIWHISRSCLEKCKAQVSKMAVNHDGKLMKFPGGHSTMWLSHHWPRP